MASAVNERTEDLGDSEEKYRQLVSTSTDAIMLFDADTRKFIDVNKACEDFYAYSREGKETIRKLIEIDPNVKAIVASGYSNDPVLANFRGYGFCGVFLKHDKTEALGKTLHKVIKG